MWAKLDDEILDNPKVAGLGPLGFALYVAGIVYASRNLTDGRIPIGKVRGLLDFSDCRTSSPDGAPGLGANRKRSEPDALAIAEVLVEAGLWTVDGRHFEINDFLVYNPTREKVLAEREAARLRMRRRRAQDGEEAQAA